MKIAILGTGFGDDGKAKIGQDILHLGLYADFEVVARFNGGKNAGQTYETDKGYVRSHLVPYGADDENIYKVVLAGCVVEPISLVQEIRELRKMGFGIDKSTFGVSGRVQITLRYHLEEELKQEKSKNSFGTTKSGIAPTFRDVVTKRGITFAEFLNEHDFKEFLRDKRKPFDVDKYLEMYSEPREFLREFYINEMEFWRENRDKNMIFTGAQGFGLDPWHGCIPYTTSSPQRLPCDVDRRIGVMKILPSSVGKRRFITEMAEVLQEKLRGQREDPDSEYGKTTGRVRKIGWPDLHLVRYAVLALDIDALAITKFDKLFDLANLGVDKIKICIGYKDSGGPLKGFPDNRYIIERCQPIYKEMPLPKQDISDVRNFNELPNEARDIVNFICEHTETEWDLISVGPRRGDVIINV